MKILEHCSGRELVLELARRLGLTEVDKKKFPDKREFTQNDKSIVFGRGCGCNGFIVEFFLENDKVIFHAVWE